MPLISCPPVPVVAASRSRAKLPPVFALPILFAWFGLIMGSWAGRIPAVREALQLSVAELLGEAILRIHEAKSVSSLFV